MELYHEICVLQLLRKIALKCFKSYSWVCEEGVGNKAFSWILLYLHAQIVFVYYSNYPTENFHLRKVENNELSVKEHRGLEHHQASFLYNITYNLDS